MKAIFTLLILTLSPHRTFSQVSVPHELYYFVGCSDDGMIQVESELDHEELFYVDFFMETVEFTVPKFYIFHPEAIYETGHLYNNALKGRRVCFAAAEFMRKEEKHLPKQEDPPESMVYPADEPEPDVPNSLICYMNRFYPPHVVVNWTLNGQVVTEGVTHSRFYPNADQTFHHFSTLSFTPKEGDVYACTVEHTALSQPETRTWKVELNQPSIIPDVFCAVGLVLGLIGIVAGVFFGVKGSPAP